MMDEIPKKRKKVHTKTTTTRQLLVSEVTAWRLHGSSSARMDMSQIALPISGEQERRADETAVEQSARERRHRNNGLGQESADVLRLTSHPDLDVERVYRCPFPIHLNDVISSRKRKKAKSVSEKRRREMRGGETELRGVHVTWCVTDEGGTALVRRGKKKRGGVSRGSGGREQVEAKTEVYVVRALVRHSPTRTPPCRKGACARLARSCKLIETSHTGEGGGGGAEGWEEETTRGTAYGDGQPKQKKNSGRARQTKEGSRGGGVGKEGRETREVVLITL